MQALKAQYYKLFGRNPKGRSASDPTWLKSEIQKKMQEIIPSAVPVSAARVKPSGEK